MLDDGEEEHKHSVFSCLLLKPLLDLQHAHRERGDCAELNFQNRKGDRVVVARNNRLHLAGLWDERAKYNDKRH